MGDLLLRNIDDKVLDQLRTRADLRGRSVEQEARDILAAAAPLTPDHKIELSRRLRARSPKLDDFDVHAAIRSGRDDEFLP
ncbi:plasmid stabilization protein [Rhodoplanes sp. TEM]|uniref:Plasmid stabilization protein n=1 Tax=Rhodoplanes tepidamans TaxID=200616 RepID=A0ABT5JBH9_RHOTP|nr:MULTISPECIES: plasmid stabilization protein [Rhodoplanes]MDC7786971.1 plasmid stabilization protein [Rhodoplanes tepidamans]MDC7985038.1 plasmid stabilization protein [Rhodoplanes sp. TEM]MDQ0355332.1 plasmid stability protein [Rhodoplanes tepidamans]